MPSLGGRRTKNAGSWDGRVLSTVSGKRGVDGDNPSNVGECPGMAKKKRLPGRLQHPE